MRRRGLGLILVLASGFFAPSACTSTPVDEGEGESAEASESNAGASEEASSGEGEGESTGTSSDLPPDADLPTPCDKNIVLMGYWPPTNEMLRPFSDDPEHNPGTWVGENWRGHGYDVYAFFPEFPPDGDPSNDPIGSPGSVGSSDSDLQVDYQDTSADFWRIVDSYQPILLVTTSRGGGIGWELEAIEGGHSGGTAQDPSGDWSSDGYGAETRPTESSVDPRSWAGISMYRAGQTLPSQLPLDEILSATQALGLTDVQIDTTGTSGNYLSGFLGLHGLLYNQLAPHNLAAGHIHVTPSLPPADGTTLVESTLEALIAAHPADTASCPD